MINPKGEVIAQCQRAGLGTPEFRVSAKGAKHKPEFSCEVYLNDNLLGSGEGDTKKRAEKSAAEAALEWLERSDFDPFEGSVEVSQEDEPFDGPWPIFPEVLAASMTIANERTNATLKGDKAIQKIKALSLTLYKEILEDLGDVVEVDE